MSIDRRISIAPMIDCTDRHFRWLARQLTRHAVLYTEMITANAVIHGDRKRLLGYSDIEQSLALQLGGSDPDLLAQAALIAEDLGYAEINLNVGCPSDRVQSGDFGVCLMLKPERVAACVALMRAAVSIPVTVKTRIGVDHEDSYEALHRFIATVATAGCSSFIIHARKAWLNGLSPKQNRNVPPLNYPFVYRLKQDFPELEIVINGGIKTHEDIAEHLKHVDGVMIGREAYSRMLWLQGFDQRYFARPPAPMSSVGQIARRYIDYCEQQACELQVSPVLLVKHMLGLFQGLPGARKLRHFLCEAARQDNAFSVIKSKLDEVC